MYMCIYKYMYIYIHTYFYEQKICFYSLSYCTQSCTVWLKFICLTILNKKIVL